MADNVLQTLQQLVQDVIAPDVRELKVRVTSLEKQMETRFEAVEDKIDSLEKRMDTKFSAVDTKFVALQQQNEAQFRALMSAISEWKAKSGLDTFRAISALSERVAVLEAARH